MRVLVVEGELKMARALRRGLEQEGYAVDGRGTDQMSRIVDNLLTLAHRDEHRLELSLAPVDLASVATAVTSQLRPLADQGGVHLTVRAAHVPSVLAD
jgi:signal transduction histidine kinase